MCDEQDSDDIEIELKCDQNTKVWDWAEIKQDKGQIKGL